MSITLTENYDKYLTLPHYRAFSATPGGPGEPASVGWSYNYRSVDRAIEMSLERCEKEGESAFVLDRCRLHSIGDINVSKMTKEQRDRAIRVYKSNVLPLTSFKAILRAKGLSGEEAFQEAKKHIGTNCLDDFERHEERHSSGLETAFAYAQDQRGGPYTCGYGYSMYVETAKDQAMYHCERGREKKGITAPCEILAIGNKIVWEGKLSSQ